MGLVDYSESESSGAENASIPSEKKTRPGTSKASFQKVVDRSNPHKIRVTLPQAPTADTKDDLKAEEPPAKRARTEGGAFSGFNSFLPAPKRAGPNGVDGTARRGKGLGSGVSLKTGAAPGFSRNPEPETSPADETSVVGNGEASLGENGVGESESKELAVDTVVSPELKAEPKKTGTAMMFKPLSVARKPQKKKPAVIPNPAAPVASAGEMEKGSKAAHKVSLFSIGGKQPSSAERPTSTGHEYKPMVFEPSQQDDEDHQDPLSEELDYTNGNQTTSRSTAAAEIPTAPETQSLDTIAADLNLSKSARRQLFGRQGNSTASAPNIVNFNTDQEYAANEALRAAGETVLHNPVKAIAPGKHNLKQLVNAASNQKAALEEHFASGKRNKKEAGSKYGW